MVIFSPWPLGPCGMCSKSPMKRTGEALSHIGGFVLTSLLEKCSGIC